MNDANETFTGKLSACIAGWIDWVDERTQAYCDARVRVVQVQASDRPTPYYMVQVWSWGLFGLGASWRPRLLSITSDIEEARLWERRFSGREPMPTRSVREVR